MQSKIFLTPVTEMKQSATDHSKLRILHVVAARPNMMKVAPIILEMMTRPEALPLLVHTGQHYDYSMSKVFFEQLDLPEPHFNLEVGGGTHHFQTGEVVKKFGELVQQNRPDCVVVVGDVNATLACGLVAAKERIPLVHVESGLRSNDRSMPEEINRIVTDSISDLLLVTEQSGIDNLRREGVPDDRVVFTGNVMIDSLRRMLGPARNAGTVGRLGLGAGGYILLTLHRPANVDVSEHLRKTMDALAEVAATIPIVFPVHPRTASQMRNSGIALHSLNADGRIGSSGIWALDPAPYRDFVALMDSAALVVTDSGGVQEETTYLGVPCLTYRQNTERPSTIEVGTNKLIGNRPEMLADEIQGALAIGKAPRGIPPLWDGKAAVRIVDAIIRHLQNRRRSAESRP